MILERRILEGRALPFRSPEQARVFQNTIDRRMRTEGVSGASGKREIVAEELAKKFEQEGVGITFVRRPWDHSSLEHAEVDRLVETAFSRSLEDAITEARASEFFPSNMDLFHDVLTSELYDTVLRAELNRPHVSSLFLVGIFCIFGAMLFVLVLFVKTI